MYACPPGRLRWPAICSRCLTAGKIRFCALGVDRMTIFLSMFVVAVLVGFMAQKWKGRTGAAWWFLTMVLEALAYGLCVVAVANRPDLLRDPVTPISMAI